MRNSLTPENNSKWITRMPNAANYFIFGFGGSIPYFCTTYAAVTSLISNRAAGIALGSISSLPTFIINGLLSPKATQIIFTKRPDVWFLLPLIFMTIGGLPALPLVASVLQSTPIISNSIGLDVTKLDFLFGNVTFLTTGILFSVGFVNMAGYLLSLTLWKVFQKEQYKFSLMRSYLCDERSENELTKFINEPDDFINLKFSRKNTISTLISILPAATLMYNLSGEISNALSVEDKVITMSSLNAFGLIPINEFVKTEMGAKIIGLITGTPVLAAFAGTATRAILRDVPYAWELLKNAQFQSLLKMALYWTLVLSTCFVGFFQSEKGGANTWQLAATFISVFWINYASARQLYFNTFSSNTDSFLAIKEKKAQQDAFKKLEEIEDQFRVTQPINQQSCLNCLGSFFKKHLEQKQPLLQQRTEDNNNLDPTEAL